MDKIRCVSFSALPDYLKRIENIRCVPPAVWYSNDMSREQQYAENWVNVNNGQMSEQQWMEYTTQLLTEILDENKDVMVRLKYR
jgi:hypothetical protein